ncbi:hypothetical protein A1O3_05457 [Capronia epimyces CBS 606.96]|uniref:DUF7905 domain-containing protein n=1 Tax=Capronia epimyces CBS 606.96 TaxID=1182542 RepID=W9Y562_9EURO|nr:uncharacterized protein A1O3_05457 [Capronia epimyces CBS 606.96]EXJ84785.1 hypothetical protein A1O3_05457 [Capronia epimyces CBS 606.96]
MANYGIAQLGIGCATRVKVLTLSVRPGLPNLPNFLLVSNLLAGWEEASLPGASAYSYAASDVFNNPGAPAGDAGRFPPTGPRYEASRDYAPRAQPGTPAALQPFSNGQLARGAPFGRQGTAIRPPVTKSAVQLRFESGQPADGEHQLASTWRAHQTTALRSDRGSQPHPIQTLQDIMFKCGTYIRKPDDQDQRLFIWGAPQQIADTKAALANWEESVRTSADASKNQSWFRSSALDGRAEHRLERQSKQRAFDDLLRQVSLDYSYEAAFVWPKELDIEDFANYHADVLDQLRSTYHCRVGFQSEGAQTIVIGANSERDVVNIMNRVLNLIKEIVSRRDHLVTVNLVHPPHHSIYRDRVGLQDRDPLTDSYLPTLHGMPAPDEVKWVKERRRTHINNRKKIKKTIDASIKRLRISQQHVRMRVVFGELGFKLFQRPSDGSGTYSFDDFFSMVTKGRTKLSMNSIPVRQGDITELPDVLDSMDAFHNGTEFYGAFFDFPATNSSATLRLETLIKPVGEEDYEFLERRWVEFGDTVSRLQVSLFNFERPDYQITIDAFPMHSNKQIKGQMMAQFQNDITFKRPPDGIKAPPHRRVKYPPGQKGLKTVSELTVKKWRFKDTDGFFELRRKELYDERQVQYSSSPVETRWHALYYYPEWDNLMGEFGTLKPGEDVSWPISVATFFPESGVADGRALPQGFKNFINEVEEIQDLLAEAIAQVAKRGQDDVDMNANANANVNGNANANANVNGQAQSA